MNKEEIKQCVESAILNGQTKETFIALILWGLLGLLTSLLIELIRHKDAIKKKGGFSFGFWIKDNIARLLLSLIAVFVGANFSEDLVGIELGAKGAFVAGLVTDKTIEALIQLKSMVKINLWKKPQE